MILHFSIEMGGSSGSTMVDSGGGVASRRLTLFCS